nr:unnamed protein product [Haemonchus contortus]
MRVCLGAVWLAILGQYVDSMKSHSMDSGSTALMIPYPTPAPPHIIEDQPSTGLVIRAKRQFGGFGCCPMIPPMCCPMPMMMIPPPIPPPIFMPSCCSCCLPVCMPICITGGCGCGGGFFGRRKRSAIIQRNPVALRLTWKH